MKSAGATRHRSKSAASIAVALGVVGSLLMPAVTVRAAGTQLYLSSSAGSVAANTTFPVAVRINTGGELINAVQANFSYPADLVDFVSIDDSNSAFKTAAPSTGGGGMVSIARGQIGGVNGDALLVTVTFRSKITSGTASMVFTTDTQALRDSDNKDVLSGTTGTSYNLQSGAASPTPNSKPPVTAPGPNAAPPNPGVGGATTTPTEQPDTANVVPPSSAGTGGITPQITTSSGADNTKAFLGAIFGIAALAALALFIVYRLRRRPAPVRLPSNGMAPYGPPAPSAPYTARPLATITPQNQTASSGVQSTITPTPQGTYSSYAQASQAVSPMVVPAQASVDNQASGAPYGQAMARPQIQPSNYRASAPGSFQPTVIRPTQKPTDSTNTGFPGQTPPTTPS